MDAVRALLLSQSAKPLTNMHDAVRNLEMVFLGDLGSLQRFAHTFKVKAKIPVYIAGNGPKMLQLSLQEADGFELARMPAEYVKHLRPQIKKRKFEFGNSLPMFVDED